MNSFDSANQTNTDLLVQYCDQKMDFSVSSSNLMGNVGSMEKERKFWELIKLIKFSDRRREELILHLGYNREEIQASIQHSISGLTNTTTNTNEEEEESSLLDTGYGIGGDQNSGRQATISDQMLIRRALIVGSFEEAVDVSLNAGLLADALLLAACGGGDLVKRTQDRIFSQEVSKRPYLSHLRSVVTHDLQGFTKSSPLSLWYETLAFLATFCQGDEFPTLCELLGNRLMDEANDQQESASICFMCSGNVERVVGYWASEVCRRSRYCSIPNEDGGCGEEEEKKESSSSSPPNMMNGGGVDLILLHQFIERSVMYTSSSPYSDQYPLSKVCENNPTVRYLVREYALKQADHGRMGVSYKYLQISEVGEEASTDSELLFRVYQSGGANQMGRNIAPPQSPFTTTSSNQPQTKISSSHQKLSSNRTTTTQRQTGRTHPTQDRSSRGGGLNQHPQMSTNQSSPFSNQSTNNTTTTTMSHHQQPSNQSHLHQQQQKTQEPVMGTVVNIEHQAPTPSSSSQMPPGWVQNMDPTSGNPYYVNTATGQSQWEPPPQPQLQQQQQPVQHHQPTSSPQPERVEMTHPQEQQRQTSGFQPQPTSPHQESDSFPQTMSNNNNDTMIVSSTGQSTEEDVGGGESKEFGDYSGILDQFTSCFSIIQSQAKGGGEKKQCSEIAKSISVLQSYFSSNSLSPEIVSKVSQISSCLTAKDYEGGLAIQANLVRTDWNDHKVWLKGVKYLLQLAKKKGV